uniref:GULP PTB domain containing engulfment adaptor 1 n=1 Tax=Propithecus coquereli TaxID=379532 RepID=A0A2K6GRW7_PROCO
ILNYKQRNEDFTWVKAIPKEPLLFARHIKKSEGQKIPKVELQISIYGVKILEPKTKEVQHNCQLHRISFCADDKTDKRIFTFICKDSESNKHLCYVFDSEKCVSMPDVLGYFCPGIVLFLALVKYLKMNKICKYLSALIDSSSNIMQQFIKRITHQAQV